MNPSNTFDVALSFAGEDRKVACEIAEMLRAGGFSVFYDEFDKASLWGEDLTVKLKDVYKTLSRFCVMFLSQNYAAKPWTNHERQAAISRAFQEKSAYILPIRLDDTEIPGLPETLGYIDIRSTSTPEIYGLLLQKLGKPGSASGVQPQVTVDHVRDVLAACYRRAIFSRMHAQMDWNAMFASLADCRVALQKMIAYIEPADVQQLVASIVGELDFIERRKGALLACVASHAAKVQVNGVKLRIIAAMLQLREIAGVSLELPVSVTEEVFFSEEEANEPPSTCVSPFT